LPAAALLRRRAVTWPISSPCFGEGRATPSHATPTPARSNKHSEPHSGRAGGSPVTKRHRRRGVSFASPAGSTYEITPYEECYGMHPSLFNFDCMGVMVPLSPDGMVSPAQMCAASPRVADSSPVLMGFGATEAIPESTAAPSEPPTGSPVASTPCASGQNASPWVSLASPVASPTTVGTPCAGAAASLWPIETPQVARVRLPWGALSAPSPLARSPCAGFGVASPSCPLAGTPLKGFGGMASPLDGTPLAGFGLNSSLVAAATLAVGSPVVEAFCAASSPSTDKSAPSTASWPARGVVLKKNGESPIDSTLFAGLQEIAQCFRSSFA